MKAEPGSVSSTFRWATTFSMCSGWRQALAAVSVLVAFSVRGYSQVSRDEALALVYPGSAIRAEQIFLTAEQVRRAAQLSGNEVDTALIARYVATIAGKVVGHAYVDTHIVRTKRESLLVCLNELNKIKRVEVTAFLEPPEYKASPAWYGQFSGKALNDELNINRAIRPIAGATLTGTAATRAVRRVLAIHQVLSGASGEERKQ